MQEQVQLLNTRSLQIPDLYNRFECASGSMIGRNHVLAGKNNLMLFELSGRSSTLSQSSAMVAAVVSIAKLVQSLVREW